MTAAIIDGEAFSADLLSCVTPTVPTLRQDNGLTPSLAMVFIGDAAASEVYVRDKQTATRAAGMASFKYRLSSQTREVELLGWINNQRAPVAAG